MTTLEWAAKFEDHEYRRIAVAKLGLRSEQQIDISTVWLGIDHGWGNGRPVIFETMIFGFDDDFEYQERYCTEAEAVEGHARAVQYARDRIAALAEAWEMEEQLFDS